MYWDPALWEGMLSGLLVFLICLPHFLRKKRPLQITALAALFLYGGAIFSLTMVIPLPGGIHFSPEASAWVLRSIRWSPFSSAENILHNSLILGTLRPFLRIVGGNFVMLMPLAILLPVISPKIKFSHMLFLCFLIPVGIESLQLLNNFLAGAVLRTVELEDVLLNGGGCLLMSILAFGIRGCYRKIKKREKTNKIRKGTA